MTPEFLSSWRLDITPLAPVHIGSGEDMDPTSYVLDEEVVYEFSPSALASVLDETDRERLLGLVDGTGGERALNRFRRFLYERREGLVAHASRAMRAAPGVRELYESRLTTVAQKETGTINRLEIERVFSHPETRMPVLPGSSLKGAIRTALLNQRNVGQDRRTAKDSRQLQKELFEYSRFETDPMRLVHVADAMSARNGVVDGFTTDTEIRFAVNRKRRNIKGKDGREIRSQAERRGLYRTLEVVTALRWRAFRGELVLYRTGPLDGKRLPSSELRWTAHDVASACNEFYRRDFLREVEELHGRNLLDRRWSVALQRLMEKGLGELLESNHAFLLRVGRHSGAESVTLDGVRAIRIMTPKGQPDRFEEQPTTWWLASDRIDASSDLLPLGWVLVELTEGGGTPASRPRVAEVLDSFHADSGERDWRTNVARRRAMLREKQEEEISKRAEAAQRRREQEEYARVAAEKRAAMTDEERELDDLRRRFDLARAQGISARGKGGELSAHAVRILKVARGWPEVTRLQAADLIEEVFKAIGFPKGKKGRERRQQLLDLREYGT